MRLTGAIFELSKIWGKKNLQGYCHEAGRYLLTDFEWKTVPSLVRILTQVQGQREGREGGTQRNLNKLNSGNHKKHCIGTLFIFFDFFFFSADEKVYLYACGINHSSQSIA